MTLLQGIWRDLVDKRLWPIALALVLVIVAVPMVLARTGGADPDELPAGAVVAGAASVEGPREAVIVAADPGQVPTEGRLRNPFADPPGAAGTAGDPAGSKTGQAVASAGAPDESEAGTSSPSTDDGSTDDDATSGGTTTTKTTGSGENGYDVSLRFGTDSAMKSFTAVPRLTPLPSATTPSIVYLGVLSGGKTAVFMIAVQASAVGDGTCRPSAAQCETLEMQEGETMFLDVTGTDGKVRQYQLDVKDIKKIGTGGETLSAQESTSAPETDGAQETGTPDAKADASSAVEAGRRAVRRARRTGAADTLDRYRFVRSRGVVVRRSPGEVRRAHARARGASSGSLRVTRGSVVVAARP